MQRYRADANRFRVVSRYLIFAIVLTAVVAVGGLTGAGEAPTDGPTMLDSCGVIEEPGEYELTESITASSVDTCFLINASDVTFDGQNHTIDGVNQVDSPFDGDPANGIVVSSAETHTDIEIRNVHATGWWRGIWALETENLLVEQTTVEDSQIGVYVDEADAPVIRANTMVDTAYPIESQIAGGILLEDSYDGTVVANTIDNSSEHGISLRVSNDNATVSDNIVSETSLSDRAAGGFSGISLANAVTNSTVENNSITDSYNRGIEVNDNDNTIVDNQILGSEDTGLDVDGLRNTVTGNVVSGGGDNGVVIDGDNTTLSENTITENRDGVEVEGSNSLVSQNYIADNTGPGSSAGLVVTSSIRTPSTESVIAENTLVGNEYGIRLTDDRTEDNLLVDNVVQESGEWALTISAGQNNSVTALDIGDSTAANTTISIADASGARIAGNATADQVAPPTDRGGIGRYVDAQLFDSDSFLNITLSYAESDVPVEVNEATLSLARYDGDNWVDVATDHDPVAQELSANLTDASTIGAFGDQQPVISGCQATDSEAVIDEPGTYVLGGDISGSEDCIEIQASDVTLDGQGHTITADSPAENAVGIAINGSDGGISNVGVSNVGLEGWNNSAIGPNTHAKKGSGLWVTGGTDIEITDVVAAGNEHAVDLTSSTGVSVTGAEIVDTGRHGVNAYNIGNSTIQQNTVTDSGSYGVRLYESSRNHVADNEVDTVFGRDGIQATTSSNNNTIEHNTVSNADSNGIRIATGSNGNVVQYNHVTNSTSGIAVRSGESVAQHNVVENNEQGLRVRFQNATAINNTVIDSEEYGIAVDGDWPTFIKNNTVIGSGEVGIRLANAENATVAQNTVTESEQHGIAVLSSDDNMVSDNQIEESAETGIWAIVAENNTISDNALTANPRGVSLNLSAQNTVAGNDITESQLGVLVVESPATTVIENTVSDGVAEGIAATRGIALTDSTGGTVAENHVSNTNAGIVLTNASANVLTANVITEVANMQVIPNDAGITLRDGADENHLDANRITETEPAVVITDSTDNQVDALDIGESTAANTTLSFEAAAVELSPVAGGSEPGPLGAPSQVRPTAPADPDDLLNISRYFEAESLGDGSFLDVELAYEPQDITGINESTLALLRHDGNEWVEVPESRVDVTNATVTGNLTEFSTVGAFGEELEGTVEPTISELDIAGDGTESVIAVEADEEITATITNEGDRAGEVDVELTISAEGTELIAETVTTDVLDPGASESVTFESVTEDLPLGSYHVTVSVTDDNVTGTLAVNPDLTGDGVPARDTTGDGLLNDLTGNGATTVADVQVLFDTLDTTVVQDNYPLFAFAGIPKDRVSIFDVQALFNQRD